jgi:cytochrome c biogenesis protein CcmG, thiol:disulfide interchange protein DsbE
MGMEMEQVDGVALAHGEDLATGTAPRRRRGGVLLWGAAALGAGVLALLVFTLLRPAGNNPLQVSNRPAPDFTMSLYGGGKLHLAALRGKTIVINFWWSQCIPCKEEAPILNRQWAYWKDKGVVFVGVDELDDPSSAAPRDFLKTYHVTYPNGWDPGYVDIEYGTTGQPETFIITPRGSIKYHYAMPFTKDATLARLIEAARSSSLTPVNRRVRP